ncbi:hypothetical protein KY320_03255, partial [Candidatus Woesearchaeota archaeon]|nr:hypothetical protein [Candidatus Woesearchaeota archaeon]
MVTWLLLFLAFLLIVFFLLLGFAKNVVKLAIKLGILLIFLGVVLLLISYVDKKEIENNFLK